MCPTRKSRAVSRLPVIALGGVLLAPAIAARHAPRAAQSQPQRWVPIVATQLYEEYEKQGNDTTLVYERIGPHLRRSDGSQYIRLTNVVGQMPEGATIVDRSSGVVWSIEYGPRKALVTSRLQPGPLAPKSAAEFHETMARAGDQPLGVKGISGVDCEGWRISPSGPSHPGGEIWVAPSLNFLIVQSKIEQGNKETINLLQNIQAGREPDPIFFQVPKDFQVVK